MEHHWRNSIKLTNELSIRGNSVAADYTGFEIPERGIFFDAGIATHRIASLIAITHCHADHICNINKILTNFIGSEGNKKENNKVTILVPASRGKRNTAELLRNHINSFFQLNMCTNSTNINKYIDIVEMRGLSEELSKKKKKKMIAAGIELKDEEPSTFEITLSNTLYVFEAIDCYHSVPTISYLLSHKKNKLKREYAELSREEIITLKKQKIKVDEIRKEPVMAFICDSSILVLEKNPHVFEYPIVMIECTFILPEDVDEAVKKRHIHWLHLEPYVKKYPNIKFILFHFSSKHKADQINAFFEIQKKNGIENVSTITL